MQPATDKEPPKTTSEEPEVDVETKAPAPSIPEEVLVLKEAHAGLDKMVAAARSAGRLESVLNKFEASLPTAKK